MNDQTTSWPLDLLATDLAEVDAIGAGDANTDGGGPHEDPLTEPPGLSVENVHALMVASSLHQPTGLVGEAEMLDEVDAFLAVDTHPPQAFRQAVVRGAENGTRANAVAPRPREFLDDILAAIDDVLSDPLTPAPARVDVSELRGTVRGVRDGAFTPETVPLDHVRNLDHLFGVGSNEFIWSAESIRGERRAGAADGVVIQGVDRTEHKVWEDLRRKLLTSGPEAPS